MYDKQDDEEEHHDRPLTTRELARLAGHLAAGRSLHPTQQTALLTEVRRLRARLATTTASYPEAPW